MKNKKIIAIAKVIIVSMLVIAININAKTSSAKITRMQKIEVSNILKRYFDKVKTASGKFIHVTDKGKKLSGKFYMVLPGKIRFEYKGGELNIVASGAWLNLDYPKQRRAVRYPVRSTPLDLILRDDIDFKKDILYLDYYKKEKFFVVEITLADKPEIGSVRLFFVGKRHQLLQWQVVDAQGKVNTIAISEVVYNKPISDRKFFLKDYIDFTD